MKKVFLVSGVIAAMGLVVFFVSCKDEEKTTCQCTSEGRTATVKLSDWDVSTCDQVAQAMQKQNGVGASCN